MFQHNKIRRTHSPWIGSTIVQYHNKHKLLLVWILNILATAWCRMDKAAHASRNLHTHLKFYSMAVVLPALHYTRKLNFVWCEKGLIPAQFNSAQSQLQLVCVRFLLLW